MYNYNCVQDVSWGSSAVGQADVYQVTGAVTARQTVWMTLMNTTAVSYQLYHTVGLPERTGIFSCGRNTQICYLKNIVLSPNIYLKFQK